MICEGALLEFCPDGASNRSSQIKKLGKIIAGWVQVESYIWGLSTTGSHPRGGAEEQAGLPTIQVKIVIVVHKSSSGSCGLGLAVSGFSLGFPQMIHPYLPSLVPVASMQIPANEESGFMQEVSWDR